MEEHSFCIGVGERMSSSKRLMGAWIAVVVLMWRSSSLCYMCNAYGRIELDERQVILVANVFAEKLGLLVKKKEGHMNNVKKIEWEEEYHESLGYMSVSAHNVYLSSIRGEGENLLTLQHLLLNDLKDLLQMHLLGSLFHHHHVIENLKHDVYFLVIVDNVNTFASTDFKEAFKRVHDDVLKDEVVYDRQTLWRLGFIRFNPWRHKDKTDVVYQELTTLLKGFGLEN